MFKHSTNRRVRSDEAPHGLEGLEARTLLAVDLLAHGPRIRFPGVYSSGQQLDGIIAYSNTGFDDADAFHIEGFLSRDKSWGDSNDRSLGEVDFADDGVSSFATIGTGIRARIPSGTPAGIYYLGVRVDSRGAIGESNEGNNIAFSTDKIVVQGAPPEIEISGKALLIPDGDTTPRDADGTGFGSTGLLGGVDHTFRIRNTGAGPLFLYGQTPVRITGAAASSFQILRQPRATILPGKSATFVVRFSPLNVGLNKATLKVLCNDTSEPDYDFRVRGTGIVYPEISVQLDFVSPVYSGLTTPVTLGTFSIGQETLFTFVVTNNGQGTLNFGLPEISGQDPRFVLVDPPSEFSLQQDYFATFTLHLDTTESGTFTSVVSFTNNDQNESPFVFSITAAVA
ncbi:MAG: choice-of-anchor D domain-containing protein [Phycisphaerales bacterium]|nr:choice-of-anchor D domain-containing protein [Phycisphaerales bacterium]